MKKIRLYNRALVIVIMFVLLINLNGCGKTEENSRPSVSSNNEVATIIPNVTEDRIEEISASEDTVEETVAVESSIEEPAITNAPTTVDLPDQTATNELEVTQSLETTQETVSETLSDNSYEMLLYTEAPNENSFIQIQYPSFTDTDKEWLNIFIYDKVQELAQIDSSLFPADSAVTIDYQSTVTFQNHKIVSFIIWGTYNIQDAAYPTTNLFAYNIDLDVKKEITLAELYNTNEEFEKVFFEKAFFPTNPITSYEESVFSEMLKLQSPEYQTVSPFSMPRNITYFLKEDGIVFSLPAIHATGSDHFEAQITYIDIQPFYLLSQNYWED